MPVSVAHIRWSCRCLSSSLALAGESGSDGTEGHMVPTLLRAAAGSQLQVVLERPSLGVGVGEPGQHEGCPAAGCLCQQAPEAVLNEVEQHLLHWNALQQATMAKSHHLLLPCLWHPSPHSLVYGL